MITWQTHGSVPLQSAPLVTPSQFRPVQHLVVVEHAWPLAEQVAPGWQVPEVAPLGTWHIRPWQQSAPEVHTPFCGWHSAGAWHTPLVQMPEQHCEGELQEALLALHTAPPSVPPVPPSVLPVPPSAPGPGVVGVRQA
jgi:hypothetical protein